MFSYMWDWLNSILDYLGLRGRSGRVMFVGLDFSGKTTLMGLLSTGKYQQHVPTHLPTAQQLQLEGLNILIHDLGGHKQARRTWRDYFPAVDGIVFIVDAADSDRFGDAKEELHGLMSDEMIVDCPILVLGNKIDKPNALSEQQLVQVLGIEKMTTGKQNTNEASKVRALEVFMVSLLQRQGYGEAFKWLAHHLPTA